MRVLCLSGGGFKGAFQVPVIEHLLGVEQRVYDLILGVSVGSLNGVLAAQGDLPLLKKLWNDVDDPVAMDGVEGFLAPTGFLGGGLFSLKPMRRKLEKHVSPQKLRVDFGCGVTVRETGEYHNLVFRRNGKVGDRARGVSLHDAVHGSSAIAVAMSPCATVMDGRPATLSDGGHLHLLPEPPDEALEIDAVFCTPVTRPSRTRSRVNGLFEAVGWALETQLHVQAARDLDMLRDRALGGTAVRVYAPPAATGGMLAAGRKVLQRRFALGRSVAAHPISLSGTRWTEDAVYRSLDNDEADEPT